MHDICIDSQKKMDIYHKCTEVNGERSKEVKGEWQLPLTGSGDLSKIHRNMYKTTPALIGVYIC